MVVSAATCVERQNPISDIEFSGAVADTAKNDGIDILRTAVIANNVEGVRAILAAGTELERADPLGRTSLYLAAELGYAEIVSMLLEAGANPNIITKQDMTPLKTAQQRGHGNVVDVLRKHGVEQ